MIIKSLEIKKTIKDISTPVKPEVILKSLEIKKPEMKTDASGIIYKVQLSASIQKVELVPKNFKGLNSISISFEDKVYKYMYGETSDYDEANRQLKEARAKGFKTAYIIVFRNGEKISIREAHKL